MSETASENKLSNSYMSRFFATVFFPKGSTNSWPLIIFIFHPVNSWHCGLRLGERLSPYLPYLRSWKIHQGCSGEQKNTRVLDIWGTCTTIFIEEIGKGMVLESGRAISSTTLLLQGATTRPTASQSSRGRTPRFAFGDTCNSSCHSDQQKRLSVRGWDLGARNHQRSNDTTLWYVNWYPNSEVWSYPFRSSSTPRVVYIALSTTGRPDIARSKKNTPGIQERAFPRMVDWWEYHSLPGGCK